MIYNILKIQFKLLGIYVKNLNIILHLIIFLKLIITNAEIRTSFKC